MRASLLQIVIIMILAILAPAGAFNLGELAERFHHESVDPDELPYNQVQFKASHNSYERNEDMAGQLDHQRNATWQGGCRALEFDCHQDPDHSSPAETWRWSVQHDGGFREDHSSLRQWLEKLRAWSTANPDHDVITLHLEMKDAFGSHEEFAGQLDRRLLESLAGGDRQRFFTPRDMLARGEGDDLVATAAAAGWPRLKELRGRFIVVLTGNDKGSRAERKRVYAARPRENLAFVDLDVGEGEADRFPAPSHGPRLFLNLHVYQKHLAWHDFCHRAARHRGFIVRAWKVNHPLLFARCLAHGVNLLATDKIRDHEWATVGANPFRPLPSLLRPR